MLDNLKQFWSNKVRGFVTPSDLLAKDKMIADLTEELNKYKQNADSSFDFGALWRDDEEGGFVKFMPYVNAFLVLILLIVVLVRS